jgi:hypothetical protein
VQRRERAQKAPEVKDNEKRPASKRYKLQWSYHGKGNSLEFT